MRALSELELDILIILSNNEGHALWELARLLGKEKSNLITILDRLEVEKDLSDPLKLSCKDVISLHNLEIRFHEPKDPLSRYIRSQFLSDTVQLLNSKFESDFLYSDSYAHDFFDLDRILSNKILNEMNSLLNDSNLFEKKRFGHVALDKNILKIVQKKPKGEDLRYLNRRLLEEAYPGEIAKSLNPMIYKGAFRKTTNPDSRQPKHSEIPYFLVANPLVLDCIMSNLFSSFRISFGLDKLGKDRLTEIRKLRQSQQISKEECMKATVEIHKRPYSDEQKREIKKKVGSFDKFLTSQYTLQFIKLYGFRQIIYRIYDIVKVWDYCWPLAKKAVESGILSDKDDKRFAEKLIRLQLRFETKAEFVETPKR